MKKLSPILSETWLIKRVKTTRGLVFGTWPYLCKPSRLHRASCSWLNFVSVLTNLLCSLFRGNNSFIGHYLIPNPAFIKRLDVNSFSIKTRKLRFTVVSIDLLMLKFLVLVSMYNHLRTASDRQRVSILMRRMTLVLVRLEQYFGLRCLRLFKIAQMRGRIRRSH